MLHLRHHPEPGLGRTPPRIAVLFALFALGMTAAGPLRAQSIFYVDIDATGANDGTSWENAFVHLQDALAVAQDGDEVWVAEGVYRPDRGAAVLVGDRGATFRVPPGLRLLGGFGGTENSSDSRDWDSHQCVLSGDLLLNDSGQVVPTEPSRQDNSYHVVSIINAATPTLVSGFVVTGGNISGSDPFPQVGAGIYLSESAAVLENLVVEGNASQSAGGIYDGGGRFVENGGVRGNNLLVRDNYASRRGGGLLSTFSRTVLRRSRFERNTADLAGGGILADLTVLDMASVDFVANEGLGLFGDEATITVVGGRYLSNTAWDGGGLAVVSSPGVQIANVVFSGNHARGKGGGVFVGEASSFDIINSTFAGNSADGGESSVHVHNASARILNSVLWSAPSAAGQVGRDGTSTIELGNSLIFGGVPAWATDLGGNIDSDPVFVNPLGLDGLAGTTDDDLRLAPPSQGIDGGRNHYLPADILDTDSDHDFSESIPFDIDGQDRQQCTYWDVCVVDIGAHESDLSAHSTAPRDMAVIGMQVSQPFPNPTASTSTIQFRVSSSTSVQATLLDALGRRLSVPFKGVAFPGSTYQVVLDVTELLPGVYPVLFQSTNHVTRTVVVAR